MFVTKPSYVILLVVFQMIFLDKTCHSQFHWGKNYQMEADNLRALLERYASAENLKPLEITPKVCLLINIMIKHIWEYKLLDFNS